MACIGGSGFVQAISQLHVNIPWDTAGVELLEQQQINGCSSEQAVNGNCCIHMHKKGRGSPCISSKQISLLQKVGVTHEANVTLVAIVVLPDCVFLISHLKSQTQIIFKPGLIWMTRTKRDPGDPTWFQW